MLMQPENDGLFDNVVILRYVAGRSFPFRVLTNKVFALAKNRMWAPVSAWLELAVREMLGHFAAFRLLARAACHSVYATW